MEKDSLSIAPGDRTIVLTDSAARNLDNMQRRVWDIENQYGAKSDEALKATWSLLNALRTMHQWPGRVFAEDDLSLIINSSITIGVIWHRKHRDAKPNTPEALLGEWSCHS